MSKFLTTLTITIMFLAFGCYHATIETGLTPSTEVIHETFAASWIYGLVPPSTVSTAAKCPNGVAKVETQHSFVNQLVGIITLGIYTPMEIKVTCAARSSALLHSQEADIVLNKEVTDEEIIKEFMRAADIAASTGKPVYIEYCL
jgi:hypothetical protein